jgi:hypothetical protein
MQALQVSDRLADGGFTVVALNPFRGDEWTFDKVPMKPEHNVRPGYTP